MQFKLLLLLMLSIFSMNAQSPKFPPLDKSPVDIAYFPAKSVKVKVGDQATPLIKVIYSRPSANGRKIFGGLQDFDKVWRIGANESTEIRFFRPVIIRGEEIPAGTYSLFAIPEPHKWTVILNKDTDIWGTYAYDQTKDLLRTIVPVKQLSSPLESLTITFTELSSGANLIIAWENTFVEVPITIK